MLTRSGQGEFLPRKGEPRRGADGFIARIFRSNNRLSLLPRDAPFGAAALVAMVSGALMIPVAESFGTQGTPASRALSITILLFAPAMLAAIYSLFFETSKVYGSLGLALAGIVVLLHRFTWDWFDIYLPFACAFTVFCAVVRVLEHKGSR